MSEYITLQVRSLLAERGWSQHDLCLIATNELFQELMARYEHAIFSGMQTGVRDGTQHLTHRNWVGNSATCAGLCFELGWKIAKIADTEAEPAEKDE